MKKLMTSLGILLAGGLMAGQLHAGFTLFDTAKDSGYIARGRFISLERTANGDRLTFRVETQIKGTLTQEDVVIEPFSKAFEDAAVGQEAIVGLARSKVDQKYRFPWGSRSVFLAHHNLQHCQTALQRLVDINANYEAAIAAELAKRAEYQDASYQGDFPQALLDAWRDELLYQVSLTGSEAAKLAAQTLFQHPMFMGTVSASQLAQHVAPRVKLSPQGTMERAYLTMLIGNHTGLHPTMDELFTMLDQETGQGEIWCAGHIGGMLKLKPRVEVVNRLVALISGQTSSQQKLNALKVCEALRDVTTLPAIRGLILGQQELGIEADKPVLRGAFDVLRHTPHTSSAPALLAFMDSDVCKQDKNPQSWWEFTRRALLAYAMINSPQTNAQVREWYLESEGGRRQFLRFLIEENKDWRPVVMIFAETN